MIDIIYLPVLLLHPDFYRNSLTQAPVPSCRMCVIVGHDRFIANPQITIQQNTAKSKHFLMPKRLFAALRALLLKKRQIPYSGMGIKSLADRQFLSGFQIQSVAFHALHLFQVDNKTAMASAEAFIETLAQASEASVKAVYSVRRVNVDPTQFLFKIQDIRHPKPCRSLFCYNCKIFFHCQPLHTAKYMRQSSVKARNTVTALTAAAIYFANIRANIYSNIPYNPK